MRRRYVQDREGNLVEVETVASTLHFVQPDIAEHGGRRQFREYLKRTDSVELGHSDIRGATERYAKRRPRGDASLDRTASTEVVAARPDQPQENTVMRRVLERLDGRAAPERKELLRLTVEEVKRRKHYG